MRGLPLAPFPGALVDREAEMELLGGELSAAREGNGRLVMIEGPAGIGKTRLLEEARAVGQATSMRLLRARSDELETGFAFGVTRQLLEPTWSRLETPRVDRVLNGAAGDALPALSPDGSRRADASVDATYRVLNGLYWLVADLAEESPLLLTVDDAHWADASSLRFLEFLSRRLDGLAVSLVIASRPDERDAGSAVSRLLGDPLARRIELAPLGPTATASVVREALGESAEGVFCDACWEATGGNPFLLRELTGELGRANIEPTGAHAAEVRDVGPRGVARAVLLRLRRLPPEAEALARTLAVLGDGADLRRAAALSGLDHPDVVDATSALEAAGILAAGEAPRFVHPTVRAAIYADLPRNARAKRHLAAAQRLATDAAPVEQVAAHLLASPPGGAGWIVETLREAGRVAVARGAPESAVGYLRRALAEPPPADVHGSVAGELGLAEMRLGDQASVAHLREALERAHDPVARADTARALTLSLLLGGQGAEALEVIDEVVASLEVHDRRLARTLDAELTSQAWFLAIHTSDPGALREPAWARLARFADGEPSDPSQRLAHATLAFEQLRRASSADEAALHAVRGLADGRLLAEQGPEPSVFYGLLNGLLVTDRLDAAQDSLDEAFMLALRRGSVTGRMVATGWLAHLAYFRGQMSEVEQRGTECLEELVLFGWPEPIPIVLSYVTDALREQGQLERATALLRQYGLTAEIPHGLLSDHLLAPRGRLLIALGREAEGVADLLEFGRRMNDWGAISANAFRDRSYAAVGLAALGEMAQAKRLLEEDEERARRWGTARAIGTALRVRASLESGPQAIERLRNAVAVLEGSPARLELAHALVGLGGALRRSASRAAAREPLRRGLELAHVAGATALETRALDELAALGVRPRRVELSGPDALTPSEHRVAALAAQGRSNREIAQALFVTKKTVEVHLTHAYRKLGIQTRRQLVDALAAERFETVLAP